MAKAYSGRHTQLLNHRGEKINAPGWVKRELSMLGQLRWNRDHSLWQIRPEFLGLLPLFEGPAIRPMRYRAQNFETCGARSKDSGFPSKLIQALGYDLSGLNTPAPDGMSDLKSELDHTRLPSREDFRHDNAAMVAKIKQRRRFA